MTAWDTLIRGGLVFDGTGGHPVVEDVAIKDGRVAARGPKLDADAAGTVIDAAGKWVMPGLLDIHTHFDLEVELAPGLPEAVRHGTTTVLMSNCSLGVVYGAQRRNGEDPIVDCFARVENIPKSVLKKVADRCDWSTSAEYYAHLDALPVGPNVIPMIPHSMLRAEVMGLKESVTRDPDAAELSEMERLLETAMDEGYVGFSTDALPFHFLAEDPHRRTKIPSQFGSRKELKRLTDILRRRDRLWQATPPKDSPKDVIANFLLTSGRLHGKPLKITAVAALDVASNGSIVRLARTLTGLFNSSILDGRFRFQALAAPFKVYWDGPINPLAEEIAELRELNEFDLEDSAGRRALLDDPGFRARFAKMWMHGKTGFGPARLKRKLRMETLAFDRDFAQMVVHSGGPEVWAGDTFAEIFCRYQLWRDEPEAARDAEEAAAFAALPDEAIAEPGFVLALFREYDTDLRWWTVSANRDPAVVRDLLNDPQILPGFNDSGAHLTNMAFYDGNLRCLQVAQDEGLHRVAAQVKRLTREPADFIGVDAGRMEVGDVADLVVIDPDALSAYDSDANTAFVHRAEFEHEQLVNRSDGVVAHVLIGGERAWTGDGFTEALGERRLGRALRHRDWRAEANVEAVAAE
ncbi:N-acyl-D-glutamate deacylase [Marinicauda salina]|uniref:N-acyl-D-glutamate deacylase n=1 Tax=Marinicauda salina TaxID=2135793 RepID=A0A2U2BTK2_9PROT|nr:amidohydrolase family protein [Marinicauda salina]PWE17334.1 N-acyl-D-glutamate deacylase [Marinicauda salina]